MPNVENIQKWIAALRSGKYIQVDGRLKDAQDRKHPKYCCLGVACEIYIAETGQGSWIGKPGGSAVVFRDKDNNVESAELPGDVARWLGFMDDTGYPLSDPVLSFTDEQKARLEESIPGSRSNPSAINANDLVGMSFEEIADAVERTYLSDCLN